MMRLGTSFGIDFEMNAALDALVRSSRPEGLASEDRRALAHLDAHHGRGCRRTEQEEKRYQTEYHSGHKITPSAGRIHLKMP